MEKLTETACKGYVLAAADAAGLSDAESEKLLDALTAAIENMTPEEAENYFLQR